jgi:hypothetical protein
MIRIIEPSVTKQSQETTMKTALAAILALGLLAGAASARTVFDDIRDSAPRADGVFGDLQNSAPRSVFDDLNASAPKSVFDQLRDTAPRSDGVFGRLQNNAP